MILSRARKLGLRGLGHGNDRVAVHYTACAFNQAINAAQGIRLTDERTELGPILHTHFDALSNAKGGTMGEIRDYRSNLY